MLKDLTPLLTKKFEEIRIDEYPDIKSTDRGGDEIVFIEPVHLFGRLYRIEDDVVFFSGTLEGSLKTACHRCLEPVEEEFCYDFDEVVYAPGKEDDYDLIAEPEGESIDLDEFVLNLFQLNLPAGFLCDEDCKGLCPVCGTNLNTSQCSCNDEIIDQRFAMLKDLFKEQ